MIDLAGRFQLTVDRIEQRLGACRDLGEPVRDERGEAGGESDLVLRAGREDADLLFGATVDHEQAEENRLLEHGSRAERIAAAKMGDALIAQFHRLDMGCAFFRRELGLAEELRPARLARRRSRVQHDCLDEQCARDDHLSCPDRYLAA